MAFTENEPSMRKALLKAILCFFGLGAMSAPVALADDCAASFEAPLGLSATGYEIVAYTKGRDCTRAVAVISIRDVAQNRSIWALSYNATDIQPLASAATPAAMTEGLRQWIEPDRAVFRTSAELPAFRRGGFRGAGSYRFFPAGHLDRRAYQQFRALDLPVFCYAAGEHSATCLVVDRADRGSVTEIGVLSVP